MAVRTSLFTLGRYCYAPTLTLRNQMSKKRINTRFSRLTHLHTHFQLTKKFVSRCLKMWFHLIASLSESQWDITITAGTDLLSVSPPPPLLSQNSNSYLSHTQRYTSRRARYGDDFLILTFDSDALDPCCHCWIREHGRENKKRDATVKNNARKNLVGINQKTYILITLFV